MRPMRIGALAAAILLAGCTQTSPEQSARDSGLMPPPVESLVEMPPADAITNPYLRQVKASLAEVRDAKFPTFPKRPDYGSFFARASGPQYQGWDTDRIDASSYDTLTNSLNAILQRMGPEQGEEFDKITKFVMMNVTRDPLVAKKAVGGGQVSDAEILQVIQSYVHGRTPKEVTELAERLLASQQAAQQGRQGRTRGAGQPAMPAGDPFNLPN